MAFLFAKIFEQDNTRDSELQGVFHRRCVGHLLGDALEEEMLHLINGFRTVAQRVLEG